MITRVATAPRIPLPTPLPTLTPRKRRPCRVVSTVICRRSDLRGLGVEADCSAVDGSWPADWPGMVRVSLEYDDGTFSLPASPGALGVQSDRVVAFLPSLLADLVKP